MEKYLHTEVTSKILEAFYRVYNNVGYGFKKEVYINAMSVALKKINVKSETNKFVELIFLGEVVGRLELDLFVQNSVFVKITAAKKLNLRDADILQNELKMSEFEVGLLLNFGATPEIKRKVNIISKGFDETDLKRLK